MSVFSWWTSIEDANNAMLTQLRLSRGFPSRMFVVVHESGSITDNDEYMLLLWVWNEGTMGLAVVRFPRFADNESVEQTTAWFFSPLVLLVSMQTVLS